MLARALVPTVIALALGACTAPRTRPVATHPPAKSSSATAAPTSGVVVLNPHNYEPQKNLIKQTLAKNSHDSLAPAETGYYMDVLQGRLKQVADKAIVIGRQGDRITLDLSARLAFEPGAAQINPGIREVLAPLARILAEYRMTLVSVRFPSDDSGAQANHPRVTEQRALALARYLGENGVTSKRIIVAGSARGPAGVELQLEPIVH